MSRVTTIEKEVESCWDCPHLLNGGKEPVAGQTNTFNIIFICKKTGYRVFDMEEFPDFCPLEEYEEDDDE